MRDIRKRTAMDEYRRFFQSLNQIWFQRFLHHQRDRAFDLEIADRDRLIVIGIGNDRPADAFFKVLQVFGQTHDRHDLRCHGDDESIFAFYAVCFLILSDRYAAQRPIVHIQTALPDDLRRINVQFIPLIDVIIQHRADQIVCRGDRMHIAGKMQVDFLHRHHLGISAAGRAAL